MTPSQQHRVLGISTLTFTVRFAVWTIFSIIGVQIKQDRGLNETEFGLLVATPILSGSLSRIFLGIWTELPEMAELQPPARSAGTRAATRPAAAPLAEPQRAR